MNSSTLKSSFEFWWMTITAFPLNSGLEKRCGQRGVFCPRRVFFLFFFLAIFALPLSQGFLRGGRSPQVFRAPERTVKNSEILRESDSFWRPSGFLGGSAPWLTNQRAAAVVVAAAAAAENLRPKWYLDAGAAGGDDISDDISEPLPRRSAHNRGRLQPSIRAVFIILALQAPHAILLSHTLPSLLYELSILFVLHSI